MLLHTSKPVDKPSVDRETNICAHFSFSLSLKLIKTINLAGSFLGGGDVQYTIFIVAASVLPLCIATRGDEMDKNIVHLQHTHLLKGVGKSKAKARFNSVLWKDKENDLGGDVATEDAFQLWESVLFDCCQPQRAET